MKKNVIPCSQEHSALRTPHSALPPRYHLRKGLAAWELTFEGQQAAIKHEQGIYYVAYLLLNPPDQPIHALDLATRIAAIHRKQAGLPEIVDPVTGKVVPLLSGARIQERSLGLDAAQTMRATLRSQHELEAILEDEDTIEPVKEEVQRELIELYRYEEKNTAPTRDSAQKAVRAVRMAIRRFHKHLATAVDEQGNPHHVLRRFAEHSRSLHRRNRLRLRRHRRHRRPIDGWQLIESSSSSLDAPKPGEGGFSSSTTIREANGHSWGTHIVAGLGSQIDPARSDPASRLLGVRKLKTKN